MKFPELPVLHVLPELGRALGRAGAAVLTAPPGSGKTTLSPLAMLDEDWLEGRRVLLLEPRRVAARLAARRMASILGEKVGETVGYRIRFERRISSKTRIEVMTEGVLVRQLQADPELTGVGLVVFDEVHERSLDTDLALTFAIDARNAIRPDLKLLVMSATIDAERLANFIGIEGPAPILQTSGRTHPVIIRYIGAAGVAGGPDIAKVVATVGRALEENSGDVLVFLPGAQEIEKVAAALRSRNQRAAVAVLPLHGGLSQKAQDEALLPANRGRRVVLATNIAESSVTIEGIEVVVDSGFARTPRFDPTSGLSRLVTSRISRTSADQRAGRAGRLGPGIAYRLWSEDEHERLAADRKPEILDADLLPLALELSCWGVIEPASLSWLDPPPLAPFAQALQLLRDLGALDGRSGLTALGRTMTEVPAHPRLACVVAEAGKLGDKPTVAVACDIAALTEGRNPILGSPAVDLEERLAALRAFRAGDRSVALDVRACQALEAEARALMARVPFKESRHRNLGRTGAHVGGLLSFGFPDRIGSRRSGASPRFLLANGRGVRMDEGERLGAAPFIVALRVGGPRSEGHVQLAAELVQSEVELVQHHRIERRESVVWDGREQAVTAKELAVLGAITLSERPLYSPPPDLVVEAMLDGIRKLGLGCLPWNEQARTLIGRVRCLERFCPNENWPDFSDSALALSLERWLGPCVAGMTRREHLRSLELSTLLKNHLGWRALSRLDQEAPTHIQVPSGRRVALFYHRDAETPVLAVKLQELFGLQQTPAIARGRVPVTVHVLSPGGRPVQITTDLAGFWARTYSEVRRELKGRYPKHYWPEDPYSAVPTHRVRPRLT